MKANRFRNISLTTILLWFLLFAFIPNLLVIGTSFLQSGQDNFVKFEFTLSNYFKIFDPIFFNVFLSSCVLAIVTTLLCLIVGYPFAYMIAQAPKKWRQLLLFLVIIPFWTSSLIRIYAIKIILVLMERVLGSIFPGIQILYTETAVLIGLVYTMLPFMILPLFSTLEKLDHRLIEAAEDLGATKIQTFTKVIIPLSMPGIIAGSMLVFLPVLGLFYVTDILGGAKSLLIGNLIKNQFLVARDWPFGSAASVFVIFLMALMLLLYAKTANSSSLKELH